MTKDTKTENRDEILKQLDTIEDNITENLSKAIDEGVDSKVKTIKEDNDEFKKDVKQELKEIKEKLNKGWKGAFNEDKAQEKLVGMFRDIMKGVPFADAKAKAMNEGTDWDGWEMVFDYFEKSVLTIMNEEPLLKELKMYNVTKSDKLKLPKYTNGVITTFENEGTGGANSQGTTLYVSIDIERAVSRTDITEELLDDNMTTPDVFNLILQDIGESQSNFIANQVVNGDGTGNNFLGILPNPDINIITLGTGLISVKDVLPEHIVSIITKAKRKYKKGWKGNLKFLFSEYVRGQLYNNAITTTGDIHIAYKDLMSDNPTLFGIKVITSDFAPIQDEAEDIAGADFCIFWNFKYYALARRTGVEVETGYVGDNFNNSIKTIRAKQRIWGESTYPEGFTKWTLALT